MGAMKILQPPNISISSPQHNICWGEEMASVVTASLLCGRLMF